MAFGSILDLWNTWNIRSFVMLSLSLQVFLILFAPLRKKVANHHISNLLWLAYLMADCIATFTIGLISHNQGNSCTRAAEVDEALLAFWASFLLLHLGGPDTITAFSLEDNSLWKWHLLNLIFQVGAAIYLFVQIFPRDKSLVIPTMLVFFAGAIKNVERTLALYLSSLSRLRKSMISRYSFTKEKEARKLVEEFNALGKGHSEEEQAKLPETIVVKHAYYFFQIFKVFIGDLMFKDYERMVSREFFYNVSAIDALRVISVELNFMYEMLHTKAWVLHSRCSYIFRFVAFTNLALAFVLFNHLKKHRLPELDVEITHLLLFGGMAIDVIALFMLVFSDWIVGNIMCHDTESYTLVSFLHKLVTCTYGLRKLQSTTCKAKPNANAVAVLNTPFIFRRWSESISTRNLLSAIINTSARKNFLVRMAEEIMLYFHQARDLIAMLCGMREGLMITDMKCVSKNLWIFIFKEIRRKSKNAETTEDVMRIFEARGDLFLQSPKFEKISSEFLHHVTETNFDGSVLSWHIATEIWYNKEKSAIRKEKREFSKILWDYMLYLLLDQHDAVSAVAGVAQMTSSDIVHEVPHLFDESPKDIEDLCNKLWWGSRLQHFQVLLNGVKLARLMERLGERKWEVMSGVWVEMLSYAAGHVKGEAHVKVLSKGGELLTFVWLLMAHFGCLYKHGWGEFHNF